VLTLDGRDKFTKILQYASRLLGWYFAGLAIKQGASSVDASSAATNIASSGLLTALTTSLHLRQQLYMALSQRFNALYKSLVSSRKAFRLGRSVIELDKLKSMGWGDYLGYMMMHPLAGGVAGGAEDGEDERGIEKRDGANNTLARYDTHPIPEEEGSRDENDGDESSWDEYEQSMDEEDDASPTEEKKLDHHVPSSNKIKVVSRPGRPKLPSRISSNVGWGPSTTSRVASNTTIASSNQSPSKNKPPPVNAPPARTVSEMGRQMYQPFPSRSSSMGSYKQLKEQTSSYVEKSVTASPPPPTTTTPSWKLIGGTVKLLGLMGFWAFDNLSFLTGTGFLDPIRLSHSSSSTGTSWASASSSATNDPNDYRMKRKTHFSIWGGRFYFVGVVGGLYVNVRALWVHRMGLLKDARDRLQEAMQLSTNNTSATSTNGNGGSDHVQEAQTHLKQTESKHFELFLALLKSCCDFMVFSNNPGIDLHLKLRGRKNHEGLHCLGGLVSASTVLYNNFPNAK